MSNYNTSIHRGKIDFDINLFPRGKKFYAIIFGESKRTKHNSSIVQKDPMILLGRRRGEKAFTLVELSTDAPYTSFFSQTLGLFGMPQNHRYATFSNNMSYIVMQLTADNPFKIFPTADQYRERSKNINFRQQIAQDTANWDAFSPSNGLTRDVPPALLEPFEEIAYVYLTDLLNITPPPSKSAAYVDTRSEWERFEAKYFRVGVGHCIVNSNNLPAPTEFKASDRSNYPNRSIDIDPNILESLRDAHGHSLCQFVARLSPVNRK